MAEDKVSIVVRTSGGRQELLAAAIASVQGQDYDQVELVVVEDGCDVAQGLVSSAAKAMPIPPVHLTLDKCGRAAAGNAGIAAASGRLCGFLDDDDILFPDHVSTLASELAKHDEAPAAYAGALEVGMRERAVFLPFSLSRLWQGNFLPIQAVLFRKTAWQKNGGFDTALDRLEDWDAWLHIAMSGDFASIDNITSRYNVPMQRQRWRVRALEHEKHLKVVRHKQRQLVARLPSERRFDGLDDVLSGRFDRRRQVKEWFTALPLVHQIWQQARGR